MKRILALLLTVIMMFGTFAIDLSAVAVSDILMTNEEGKPIPGEVDWESTVKQYLTLPFESEREKLATMEMMYEKDGYQLWADLYTGEVATVKLESGQILLSNPYDIGIETDIKKGTSENIRNELFSQIIIKYTDNDTDKTMNSFKEAASRGQVNFEYIKNGAAFYPEQEVSAAGAVMGTTDSGYLYIIVHENGATAEAAIENSPAAEMPEAFARA